MPATIVQYDLKPRLLQVRNVQRITPRMVRVTLGGDDLDGFQGPAPADHVKVFFPADGADLPIMPTLGPNGLVPPPPGTPRPVFRDYTVRAHRPGELDLDFVIHGEGPASTWAAQASEGQTVGVLGPRGSVLIPMDLDWYLVAGDETALPAVARFLEQIPAGRRVLAYVEVADVLEEQKLTWSADVTLTWLHRNGAEPGATTLLLDAITATELPPGDGFAWIAGEATTLKPIRRHLRDDRALPSDAIDVDGYWKRGIQNLDHHAPDED
ncbi:siderophore-interacting protein [Actinoplanes capillaceus]|uniref:Siderophore-interacting protein n=1 Tax=Actinoplanes campanulatus TaxID=113559 RepID=A0ABQ3WKE6_9ACTN|nr:siderophore-interacting protein [Actinoplanes capillaceus]GID46704.1 siderophore-interacting protein [Actinoplanes capillaceus]